MRTRPDVASQVAMAIELAQRNASDGELPFAALVLDGGEVIATGVNRQLGDDDPFAHAEVVALRAAWRASPARLGDAVLVSSCQPCALCLSAAATVGIVRILYAATRDDVHGLGEEADPDHEVRMRAMADALGAVPPTELIHVPSRDDRAPFDTWVRLRGSGR